MGLTVVFNHKGEEKEQMVGMVGILKDNGELEVFDEVEGPKVKFYRSVLMTLDEGENIGEKLKERDDSNMAFVVRIHGCRGKEMFVLTRKYVEGRHGKLSFENGSEWKDAGNGFSENLVRKSVLKVDIFKEQIIGTRSRIVETRLLSHVVGKVEEEESENRYKVTKEVMFGENKVIVSGELTVEGDTVKRVFDCEDADLRRLVLPDMEQAREKMFEKNCE